MPRVNPNIPADLPIDTCPLCSKTLLSRGACANRSCLFWTAPYSFNTTKNSISYTDLQVPNYATPKEALDAAEVGAKTLIDRLLAEKVKF